jgi:hypothetical protein
MKTDETLQGTLIGGGLSTNHDEEIGAVVASRSASIAETAAE